MTNSSFNKRSLSVTASAAKPSSRRAVGEGGGARRAQADALRLAAGLDCFAALAMTVALVNHNSR